MEKAQKERLVAELTEKLQQADTLLVADYRGLSMSEIDALRTEVLKHGATFQVVKNTLTRRAAEAAGQDALLAMLEGPTGIAFLESDGDPVAVAKALSEAARTTKILSIRGGILEGRTLTEQEVEDLAKLPPVEVVRGQVLGAILGPLTAIAGLVNAPLQNLYGLIEARIEQLEQQGDTSGAEAAAPAEEPQAAATEEEAPAAEAEAPAAEDAPAEEAQASADAATAESEAGEAAADPDDGEPQQAAEASTEEPAEGAPEEPEETQE
jgi:large subunit ribosomal protein L10